MACGCVTWPIVGTLDQHTRSTISKVFVFNHGKNCIYVTREGRLFVFGSHGKHSPPGKGSLDFTHEPQEITGIRDEGEEII